MKYAQAWEELKESMLDMVEKGYTVSPYAVLEMMDELENEYE